MIRCRSCILGIAILLALSATALADDAKFTTVGDEFQVNTYVTNVQKDPAVAVVPNGNFMVVWESIGSVGVDPGSFSIQGRLFASDGSPLGSQFQVNTYTTDGQRKPAVAGSEAGFVVVWMSEGSSADTSDESILGQRYAPDGSPVGSEFQANAVATGYQKYPAVANAPDGGFVVVWNGEPSQEIFGRRFSSDGSAIGGDFQVNTYTTDFQGYSAVTMDAAGSFVVVWSSEVASGDDDGYSVQGQRFASDGSMLGSQFQINSFTTEDQEDASVAATSEGDFVVVWTSDYSTGTDTASTSVQGQRYASDGSALGGEFQINSYTTEGQGFSSVAVDAEGNFTVVWESGFSFGTGPDGSGTSVQAQRFAADGSAIGDEFQVNSYTTALQTRPKIAADADRIMMVWEAYATPIDTGAGIGGQLYELEADLSITQDDGVTSADPGGQVIYTIVASNAGPDSATATVTDLFPAELTCSWISVAMGGATGNTDSTGDLMDLVLMPAGSLVTYTVTCVIDASASGTLSNTATISSPLTDATPGTNSATDDDTVLTEQANLSIVKTGPGVAEPSSELVYTLTVENLGTLEASSLTLTDTLPAGTTFVSASGGGFTCGEAGGVVTCTRATLAALAFVQVKVTVRAPASEGTISNTVDISASSTDFDSSNDSSIFETAITGPLFTDGFESGNTSAWSNTVP